MPVRVRSSSEVEIDTLVPPSARQELRELEAATVRYRFVEAGLLGPGLWRNGQLLRGIELERFEAKLVTDPVSGADFVRLAVTGVNLGHERRTREFPGRVRTARAFVWDVVYLQRLEDLRRHCSAVANPIPVVRLGAAK